MRPVVRLAPIPTECHKGRLPQTRFAGVQATFGHALRASLKAARAASFGSVSSYVLRNWSKASVMFLLLVQFVNALAGQPRLAADEAAPAKAVPVAGSVSRPVEGILLPWNSRGFWPFSATGDAPSPESLVRMAVVEEVRGAYVTAYHNYRRVLVQYPHCKAPDLLHDVYLGMSRCLMSMGRSDEAARLLLRLTAVHGVLRGVSDARELLELVSAGITDDEALKSQVEERLRSWPAEKARPPLAKTVAKVGHSVESIEYQDKAAPQAFGPDEPAPEAEAAVTVGALVRPADADKAARDLYERVVYYCRMGQADAAQVYVDVLGSRFPQSRYLAGARAMVARVGSRRQ